MITPEKPNPFHILRLSTRATLAEIVARGEELYQLAESKEEEMLFRWATEQLKTNVRTRLAYELFEFPEAQYEDEEWEAFIRRHRRKPVTLATLAQGTPPLSVEDVNAAELLQQLLESEITIAEADPEPLLHSSPFVPRYTLPLEEWDVICG
ncbi:hypothetical protein KSC_057860 [Ktedonobacter sp. SOSP1-52]|uniref:hypothetical protein n=1 Tax=Ktedonobacter sp. SOSP1-52 TaxID=2778366 RepID=UPI00191532A1|nr:hypothetical protein [Ktedonobacter sp. SOSP1-52]GHO66894.1 hypothetical protein KSC_057860 [Ktedonobacter sp. SOSP1-52]